MNVDLDIELYENIISGKRKKFPNGYWKDVDGKIRARKLTKYMLENILSWNRNDIKEKLMVKVFKKYKLGGMLSLLYRDSYFELINEIYPDEFKPWEFNQTYSGFWTLENAAIATRWMIEEKLKWNDIDIKEKLTGRTFCDNNLGGMISNVFSSSPYDAINNAYPDKFKPWEMKMSPMGLWTLENSAIATRWMIEKKLKWNDIQIKGNLTGQVFYDNDLCGMISNAFGDSPYDAINNAYPNKFKPWELKMSPLNFWNKVTGAEATRWMIEEKLKWNKYDIQTKLTQYVFQECGLGGMLMVLFHNSTFEAINNAYPDKFKPWELIRISSNFWDSRNNILEAINWAFKKEDTDVDLNKLNNEWFSNHQLYGLLKYYKGNSKKIINIYKNNSCNNLF